MIYMVHLKAVQLSQCSLKYCNCKKGDDVIKGAYKSKEREAEIIRNVSGKVGHSKSFTTLNI